MIKRTKGRVRQRQGWLYALSLIHHVLCNTVCRNRKNPVICFHRLGNLGACTLQAQHTKTCMHRQTVSWQRLMNWKKLVLIVKVTQDCIFICQGGEEVHSLHCNKLKSELNRNSAALLSNEIVKIIWTLVVDY